MLARSLPNFHDAFMEYTSSLPTGDLFREWAGLAVVSGALTRRVWVVTRPGMPHLYPNLFILFIGDPGTGKDAAMDKARDLWVAASDGAEPGYALNIGAKSISPKGLMDAIASDRAKMILVQTGKTVQYFHSVLLCAGELGTLFPEYNKSLSAWLCDLYNCPSKVDDQVRNGSGAPTESENPHLSFLLGTQPSFLGSTFPEEAYGTGFFSRINFVFEPVPTRKPLYVEDDFMETEERHLEDIWQRMVSDVRQMTHLHGRFRVDPEVRRVVNQFHMTDCDLTALPHSRFKDYNTRRSLHLQKMAMCFSAARSNALIVEMEDYEKAFLLLSKTEKKMAQIFADLATNQGFHNTVEEILMRTTKDKPLIREQELVRVLRRRHRPFEVGAIISNMLSGGELLLHSEKDGLRTFRVRQSKQK